MKKCFDKLGTERQKANEPADTLSSYTPTDAERRAAERVSARQERKAPTPKFKVEMTGDKAVKISGDHPEPAISHLLLADALGTGDFEFAAGLLGQLADVSRSGKSATTRELDFTLSLVRGIGPRDETEALLAAQMAAVHVATMTAARVLKHVETITQQDSASTMLNKLARTFAAQVEALKKYRSGGEQTIKVQHVTVNEGGRAIVGNVSQGGGGTTKTRGQPHEPCATDECSPALLGHEQTLPNAMPGTGGERMGGVPVPRGAGRSAKGPG
jgi:hypothetical protein